MHFQSFYCKMQSKCKTICIFKMCYDVDKQINKNKNAENAENARV